MSRKNRAIKPGVNYHVMSQINRLEHFLADPEIKEMFLNIVVRAKEKYFFSLRNFCIMDNHFHMDIRPKNNDLSRIMQWIKSMFARAYNKKTGIPGRVWRGRFKSKIIEDELYEQNLFEYISNNPLRAGMVQKAGEYRYSGFFCILKEDFRIVDPPDKKLRLLINRMLIESEESEQSSNVYVDKQKQANRELGFYPMKPGRKLNHKKAV